jgi:hypothetical protein
MDKYFNVDVDEMMVDFSEMTGFDFSSREYQEIKRELGEYAKQPYTFKYGNYDMIDYMHALCQGA